MGSISCCDKRIYPFFRENQKEESKLVENLDLRRNNKPQRLLSVLAFQNKKSFEDQGQNEKQNNDISPRNRTLNEMDDKLKRIHQKKNHKNGLKSIEKLSGKKLLTEVFS